MWYHYIGIGGVGMSALAAVMLSKGYKVTGSDIRDSNEIQKLRSLGAEINIMHSKDNIKEPDVVVYSSAVSKENPERVKAREKGIKEIHRSINLAELLNNSYGVAIAGSHGKTTTSAMVAYVLHKTGLSPTAIIGGNVPQLGGNYLLGESSIVVAESDESDGSFVNYLPEIGTISSVEADHLENYQFSFDKLFDAYIKFVTNIKSLALICVDDSKTRSLVDYAQSAVITYGLTDGDLRAYDIEEGLVTKFFVRYKEKELGEFSLKLPGKHNVANALCVIGIAQKLGIDLQKVKDALFEFSGTGRRFEKRFEEKGLLVIDDYGHHPTEVQTTVEAAKNRYPEKELWLAFQPHRYSRTKLFWEEFPKALAKADKIVVLGIYAPPPELPIPGVDGRNLALEVEKLGKTAYYTETLEEAAELIKEKAPQGALVLTMGAGSVTKLPDLLHSRLVLV